MCLRTLSGRAPSSSESLNSMQTAIFLAWKGADECLLFLKRHNQALQTQYWVCFPIIMLTIKSINILMRFRCNTNNSLLSCGIACLVASWDLSWIIKQWWWWIQWSYLYLSKTFLSIILEVFWVDIEVVVIDGKWLGALCDAGHKLLHLQKSTSRPVAFKVPNRNVGGSDAICWIRNATN